MVPFPIYPIIDFRMSAGIFFLPFSFVIIALDGGKGKKKVPPLLSHNKVKDESSPFTHRRKFFSRPHPSSFDCGK